jgi:hypothetical protein
VVEEGGLSLVDCTAVVWWLHGGCTAVLKVSSPGKLLQRALQLLELLLGVGVVVEEAAVCPGRKPPFFALSALRAHTKSPYKTDFHRETLINAKGA